MKKSLIYVVLAAAACLLGRLALAGDASTQAAPTEEKPKAEAKAPEFIKMDKVGKLQTVNFPHAKHGKMFTCKDCHGGETPLFPQKRSEAGMKMADMRAGKGCGSCHNGKKEHEGKPIFASTMCMKCHKAVAKAEGKAEAPKDTSK